MKILGMGMVELIIILVIVAVLFGPRLLKLGTTMKDTAKTFKAGLDDEDLPLEEDPAPKPQRTEAPKAAPKQTATPAAKPAAAAQKPASTGKQAQNAGDSKVWTVISAVLVVALLAALVLRMTGVWA